MKLKKVKDIHFLLSSGTNALSRMLHNMNKAERIARLLVDSSPGSERMTLALLAEELCGERITWRLNSEDFEPLEIPDYAVFFWRCGNVVSLGRNETMVNEYRIYLPDQDGGTEMNVDDDKLVYVRAASTTEILQIAEKHGKTIKQLIKRGAVR